jgi:hypothetical protein
VPRSAPLPQKPLSAATEPKRPKTRKARSNPGFSILQALAGYRALQEQAGPHWQASPHLQLALFCWQPQVQADPGQDWQEQEFFRVLLFDIVVSSFRCLLLTCCQQLQCAIQRPRRY